MAMTERISTGCTLGWNSADVGGLVDIGLRGTCPAVDVTPQVVSAAAAKHRDYLPGLREARLTAKVTWDRQDSAHAALQADFDAGTKRTAAFVFESAVGPSIETVITGLNISAGLGDAIMADIEFDTSDPTTWSLSTGF